MPASPERETIIRISPSEPTTAHVWTTEAKLWRKFERAEFKPEPRSDERGHFYVIPARMILIRGKVPAKRHSGFKSRSRPHSATK